MIQSGKRYRRGALLAVAALGISTSALAQTAPREQLAELLVDDLRGDLVGERLERDVQDTDQRQERGERLRILLRGHCLVRAFGWRYLVPDGGQIGGAGLSVGGRQLAGVVLLARPVDDVGLDLQ